MKVLRSLAVDAAPLAGLIAFQAVIGVIVNLIDAYNGLDSSNALYSVFVQITSALLYLAVRTFLRAREWRAFEKLREDPLNSELPAARGETARRWKALALAQRREAARLLSERGSAAAADMEAFVASIHAMKAPVATLGLLAEASERMGDPLRPRDIKLEAEELDRLLELSLGRIRLADFERDTRIEPVELLDLVTGSVRRCRRLFIARGISLDLAKHAVHADTDRKWIAFILDQIIVNAAKYATKAVGIDLCLEDSAAEIRIQDDGPGIPKEDRERVSTRSFVGIAGRAADGSGLPSSGYGLHLAFRAAEKLGIGVTLEDAEGGGTVATVRVPVGRKRFE